MKEYEVKILNLNIEETKNTLNDLHIKFFKKEKQVNTQYKLNTKDGISNYLRLRKSLISFDGFNGNIVERSYLTYKEKKDNEEYYDESEMSISDDKMLSFILDKIDVKVKESHSKTRETYIIKNKSNFKGSVYLEFDQWDKDYYEHPYMEIEATHEEDIATTIDLLFSDKDNIIISKDSIQTLVEKEKETEYEQDI